MLETRPIRLAARTDDFQSSGRVSTTRWATLASSLTIENFPDGWCNGNTTDFDSVIWGSNPWLSLTLSL